MGSPRPTIDGYLKKHWSDWAMQSGGTPATVEISHTPKGQGEKYAYMIVLKKENVDKAIDALTEKTTFQPPSTAVPLSLRSGFQRVTDLPNGNSGINLSLSEAAVLENAISPRTITV